MRGFKENLLKASRIVQRSVLCIWMYKVCEIYDDTEFSCNGQSRKRRDARGVKNEKKVNQKKVD